MISNQIIPGFYIVEVQGDAVKTFFSGDFGIEKIYIGSKDFETDLDATDALKTVLQNIKNSPEVNAENCEEEIEFNPEFFPSLTALELTPEQEDQIQEIEEQLDKQVSPGKVAVAMTRVFDSLGDFIESKWLLKSQNMQIQGKVGVNPDAYLKSKAIEKAQKSELLLSATTINLETHYH